MSYTRVLLPYKDDEGNFHGETLRAKKVGSYYRISSLPFEATNIALNDLIDIRKIDGKTYFQKMIKNSGHSLIQMIVYKEREIRKIGRELEELGCTWKRSDIKNLIAFDIPPHIPYAPIRKWLDQGEKEDRWGYKEACLSHNN